MRIRIESLAFVLIVSIILACSAAGAAQVFSTTVPISFIENNGQTDGQVLYFANAAGYTLYLTGTGEVISTADPATAVQIAYTGSNPAVTVSGENKLAGKANFLIGNDKDKWVTDVPTYGSVRYAGLYDGISVVYQGGISTLKKEFIVEPGADPLKIQMKYTGQEGLALDDNGALLVTTTAGTFFETPPVCYQVVDDAQVAVLCRFVLEGDGVVTFSVGAYDGILPLIIDPQYDFSTYLGGAQDDIGSGIGLDDEGNVYVVGSTQSTMFPLPYSGIYQEHLNGSWDIFASKFSPDGKTLIYSTYIGGKKDDIAGGLPDLPSSSSLAVNNETGIITFTGSTNSPDYPRTVGLGPGEGIDGFVTRLNENGDGLVWSRFIWANKTDVGTAVALLPPPDDDYCIVVGYTNSNNFSANWPGWINTKTAFDWDGFVIAFDPSGTPYRGRYLGGNYVDYAYDVVVEPESPYHLWITGSTTSTDFPITPIANPPWAYRKTLQGKTDAFITRLNYADFSVDRSTYVGGAGNEIGRAIDIDSSGYPYITGYTETNPPQAINLFPIFPNPQAFQTTFGGGQWDAFVTKMNKTLNQLNYSTYLGGLYDDRAYDIAVDNMSRAYVTGYTISENFPITLACTIQSTKGLGYQVSDAFVTELNETGTGLIFSTYLGGTYYDEGNAIAITNDGLNITVTGYTDSINFPNQNAYQPDLGGFPATRFKDAFVTKIVKIPPVADFYAIPESGCTPANISFFDNSTGNPISWNWSFGDGNYSNEKNPWHIYINPGSVFKEYNVTLNVSNCEGTSSFTNYSYIRVCPQPFADFNATNTTGCLNATGSFPNATIQFNVTYYKGGVKTGPAKVWNWSFGDGTYNLTNFANRNVTHTYNTTGNFTVSLTYENTCCNNTTVKYEYIDIREKPNASFYAIPEAGLIPLHVNFFDNSTGRPSNWTWTFGASQGGSNEQNPEHIYTTKGAYNVKLMACNFCGCDNETKNKYIKAGVPNLSFAVGTTMILPNGTIVVPTCDITPIDLILQDAENGLSGYNITVYWDDPVHGDIISVQFPPWAANQTVSPLPDWKVQITAVDLLDQVHPGATHVLLATLNLKGNISTFSSSIPLNISVNELDDNNGTMIDTNNMPANIMVVRLLPFPTKTNCSSDPYGDQIYWDVNGNGRIDFDDVITYYQNMQWIRDNQYHPFFNYNGNVEVPPNYGIDFADLIALFNKVGT